MREKVYVDRLFADYEDTPEIRDFKEEIVGNLKERIRELMSKGLDEDRAFDKAAAELGDITAIADEAGRRKRNEAIGRMYMMTKVPLTKRTAGGLTAATGLLLAALGLALVTFFNENGGVWLYYVAAALFAAACGMYTYFGLTQETHAHHPMRGGRAAAYGVACAMAVLAVDLGAVLYFFDGWELYAALGVEVVLLLPAVCSLIFMLATEGDRKKPWLREKAEREFCEFEFSFNEDMVDPVKAARFGVASGGLWILAVALVVTLYVSTDWQYPWLVFLFALAAQAMMVATIFGRNDHTL
ncbi:MAG: permease prefix domain 1-containing protein [Methanomassiliicoccaceae archaeon]|nr:permease prefix domain 1-containing protein [Methanomassiliicoccaceae archaeon]